MQTKVIDLNEYKNNKAYREYLTKEEALIPYIFTEFNRLNLN